MRKIISLLCCLCFAYAAKAQYPPHQDVEFESTNLPLVIIDTQEQEFSKDDYIVAYMKIVDNPDGVNYLDLDANPYQHIDYEGYIAIKYRGNSSFNSSDKKPYAFQTLESNVLPQDGGSKTKVSLLGMGRDSKWAVIAPYADKVLFRDILTYDLARPYMDFTPQAKLCEFVIDGVYYGVFAISERVSGGKDRLNLHDPGEDGGDLTGDYHVEVDRSDEPNYTSDYHPWADLTGEQLLDVNVYYQYKDPEEDDFPDGAQEALIQEIKKMEDAFASDDFADQETGYRKYIDVTSFIDYMLSTELAMNIDGYRLSTNLYKYSETRAQNEGLDSRWKMALWDFNLAWGNADYADGERTNVWHYVLNTRHPDHGGVPFYWCKLMQDPNFVDDLKQRWAEYRSGEFSDERIMAKVDSLVNLLTGSYDANNKSAADRNFEAWMIQGNYVWPNKFYGNSYEEDVDYMKTWIRRRLRFMDRKLLGVETTTVPLRVSSGWNADVIAEIGPVAEHVTRGMDVEGHILYSESYNSVNGMPSNRRIVSKDEGVVYKLQPYDENNCVALENGDMKTVDFEEPFSTTAIHVLMNCTHGDTGQWEVTVNYTDGTSETPQMVYIRDWVKHDDDRDGSEAMVDIGAMDAEGNDVWSREVCMYEETIFTNPEKDVASITINCVGTDYCTFAFAFSMESDAIGPVAQVGEEDYDDLASAFAALNETNNTITLLSDCYLTDNIVIPSTSGIFNIVFGDYVIYDDGYTVAFYNNVFFISDKETNIFASADPDYVIRKTYQADGSLIYALITRLEAETFFFSDLLAENGKTPYDNKEDQHAMKITYLRQFSENVSGHRQCWFVPFDYTVKEADLDHFTFYKIHMITASNNPEGGEVTDPNKVYLYINSVDAGTVLHANCPYIVKPKQECVYEFVEEGDLTLKAITTEPILSVSTATNEYNFYGTYSTFGPTENDKEWLTMNTDGNLMWNKGGKHDVKPYRWYIVPTQKGIDYANSFVFVENGDSTTGITALSDATEMVVEGFYSVDGMRLAEPVKGLNIVSFTDGKTQKVIIK